MTHLHPWLWWVCTKTWRCLSRTCGEMKWLLWIRWERWGRSGGTARGRGREPGWSGRSAHASEPGRWQVRGCAHPSLCWVCGGAEREVSLQRLRLAAGKDKNLYCCTYCKILKISRKCVLFLLQSKIVTKFLSSIPPTVARIVLSFALLHMTIISNDIRAQ